MNGGCLHQDNFAIDYNASISGEMESPVERILASLPHAYANRTYIETILKEVLQEQLPVDVFRECVDLVHDKVDWSNLVVTYGNKETFFFMYEKCTRERLDDFSGVFEAAAQSEGRLALVLSWLQELGAVEDVLCCYIYVLNYYPFEIDRHVATLCAIIDHLKIDPYNYDWGADDSAINKWLFRLRDQV